MVDDGAEASLDGDGVINVGRTERVIDCIFLVLKL